MKKTRMTKPGVLSAYLFACCMLLAVANANAQTWNGSVNGSWDNDANWSVAPGNGSNLTFSGTANQANTNDAGITSINTLTLSNGGWDINLGGADVKFTAITTTDSSKLTGNIFVADATPRVVTLNGISATLTLDGTLKLLRTNSQTLTVNGAGNTLVLGGLILVDGGIARTRTIDGTGDVVINGSVANGGSGAGTLIKTTTGTLTLKGNNTYTGRTTFSTGTVDLGGSTANGSLASTNLTLGSAVFNYTRTGSQTQTFTTTTLTNGASIINVVAGNTLNLGAIIKGNGKVDFGTTGTITTTTTNDANGILGGWATFGGTNWAVKGAGDVITGYVGSYPYTLTSDALNDPANYTGQMISVNSSQAPTGVITPATLNFRTANPYTLTLATGNNDIDGIIMVSSEVGNYASVITGGTLRSCVNGALSIFQNNTANSLTISSIIANNTLSSLVKSGAGTLVLTGANTYTGATVIHGGTLQLGDGGATGGVKSTSAIVVNGNLTINRLGALVQGTDGVFANNITGTGSVSYTGPVDDVANKLTLGTNTHSGGFIINSGTITGIATGNYAGFGTGTLTIKGDTILEGAGSYAPNFNNNMDWDAGLIRMRRSSSGTPLVTWNGRITLKHNAILVHHANTYSINHIFNGNIGEDVAGRTFSFIGGNTSTRPTYTLNGTNTYTGNTTTDRGSLVIGGSGCLGGGNYAAAISVFSNLTYSSSFNQVLSGSITAVNLTKDTANSTLTLSNATGNTIAGTTTVSAGTLLVNNTTGSGTGASAVSVTGGTIGGTGTIGGNVTIGAAGSVAPGAGVPGTLTVATNVVLQGTLAIDISDAATPKCDKLAVGGILDITSGALTVTVNGTPGQPVYVIATYGTLTGSAFASISLPAGYEINYAYSGNLIAVVRSAVGATVFRFW